MNSGNQRMRIRMKICKANRQMIRHNCHITDCAWNDALKDRIKQLEKQLEKL